MRIGSLRHEVTISQESASDDSQGGYGLSWTTVGTVYGEVRDLSTRELLQAQQAENSAAVAIVIRYRSDVTAKMRAVVGSTVYNIVGVRDPDGRSRQLILDCERGVAV